MILRRRFSICVSCLLICAFVCWTFAQDDDDDQYRTVETKLGKIRGLRKETFLNQFDYYAFRGIYYAKHPVGKLRFKAPEPIEPWTETLDAFQHANTCIRPQLGPMEDHSSQGEDCLALNIYVPAEASAENKLPVLFMIHGGGYNYMSGNDDFLGPDYLMEQEIIFVTINYRLGVLGFLSLNTPTYSGNMGLKDQQMALKWVHEHIGDFYGDNKRITISGFSAGSSSAHLHVLLSESRQYINNAILLSGTMANHWALTEEVDHIAFAYKIASELGQPRTSLPGLIKFLIACPAEKFASYAFLSTSWFNTLYFKFSPVIERKDAVRPILTKPPFELYKDSVVDMNILFSSTQTEMSAFISAYSVLYPAEYRKMNKNFLLKLPFRGNRLDVESEEYRNLTKEVREFYFGEKRVNPKSSFEYSDMISDMNFDFPVYMSIKRHIQEGKGKVYALRFSVNSTLNVAKRLLGDRSERATHTDELCYIFTCYAYPYHLDVIQSYQSEQSRVSIQTITTMTKIVSNFVKYGEPTYQEDPISEFPPVQCFDIHYLNVTNDGMHLEVNPRKRAVEFWEELERKGKKLQESLRL